MTVAPHDHNHAAGCHRRQPPSIHPAALWGDPPLAAMHAWGLAVSSERVRGGLTRRTVVASAVLVLVIGAAFAVLVLAIGELRKTTRLSTTSQEVLDAANTLERFTVDL